MLCFLLGARNRLSPSSQSFKTSRIYPVQLQDQTPILLIFLIDGLFPFQLRRTPDVFFRSLHIIANTPQIPAPTRMRIWVRGSSVLEPEIMFDGVEVVWGNVAVGGCAVLPLCQYMGRSREIRGSSTMLRSE